MKKLLLIIFIVFSITSCNRKKETDHQSFFNLRADSLKMYIETNNPEQVARILKDLDRFSILDAHKVFTSTTFFTDTVKPYNNNYYQKIIDQYENREKLEKWANKNFKAEYDEFEKTTWYKSKLISVYVDQNLMNVYAGEKEGHYWFRYTINYKGNDWIFFNKAQLISGDLEITLNFDRSTKTEDHSGGIVWEYIDLKLEGSALIFFSMLDENSTVKYRLSGDKIYDGNLSKQNIKGIIQMIDFKNKIEEEKYTLTLIEEAKSKLIP